MSLSPPQQLLSPSIQDPEFCPVELSKEWQILGPFQIGTREATWGADPLEYQGGFRSLEYDSQATFHSSLASNGKVNWKVVSATSDSRSACHDRIKLKVRFPEIDWAFIRSVFGWSALQYQGWARGEIVISGDSTKTIVLYTDNVLELWLDNELHFGGDFYTFRRAPLVVHLEPGRHRLDLRIVRDLRAMGGTGDPEVDIDVEAQVSHEGLFPQVDKILLPELVNGMLISKYVSIPIRNDGRSWIFIKNIESVMPHVYTVCLHLKSSESHFAIAPGQSRPLTCELVASDLMTSNVSFVIHYSIARDDQAREAFVTSQLSTRSPHEPQRFTFMSNGGAVSYAILRPPLINSSSVVWSEQSLPILVYLHGAGVDADSEEVRHTLDAAAKLPAWVVFPTGGSLWCGDDWHTVGLLDVQAAIASIPDWIHAMRWTGPGVNLTKILFSGHSNGGQGAWFATSHHPDLVIAAAPVSGYSSIQTYVSYNTWHEMDPRIAMILGTSLSSYRHELLVSNLAGIPILQQHGSADDNVPVFHSRRLSQLISQAHGSSKYVELEGKGHWFDGIMTSKPLQEFYESMLKDERVETDLPMEFDFIIPNSGDLGSKGGIHVDQLMSPDRLGHIKVSRLDNGSTWALKTSNILRFHFSTVESRRAWPKHVVVDSQAPLLVKAITKQESQYFLRNGSESWTVSSDNNWKNIGQRRGTQLGALDAFLRTKSRFRIESYNTKSLQISVQISRSLFQYFGADTEISTSTSVQNGSISGSNIIHISIGFPALPNVSIPFPISIDSERGIIIQDAKGRARIYPLEPGLGAIFLVPLPDEKLSLTVWGVDRSGLDQVARLIPALTGVGQPDFIVCNRECAWKGAAGVLAMGFFDYKWATSDASYLE